MLPPASIAIKRAYDSKLLCEPVPLEGGVVTRSDEYWRKVKVKFDIEDNKCDVSIGGHKVSHVAWQLCCTWDLIAHH